MNTVIIQNVKSQAIGFSLQKLLNELYPLKIRPIPSTNCSLLSTTFLDIFSKILGNKKYVTIARRMPKINTVASKGIFLNIPMCFTIFTVIEANYLNLCSCSFMAYSFLSVF
jgi:hypothetical protein